MGGCSFENDLEYTSVSTLVLVGRTGSGKSATANSIVGPKTFESKRSCSGITTKSELKSTVFERRLLHVIDTPGLSDCSRDLDYLQKEIVRSIDLARGGMHALLVVFSVFNQFADEEKAVISRLVALFGSRIYDYMIFVFTGGDELRLDGISLEEFLSDCSQSMKELLRRCGNRYVLFDNKTRNQVIKFKQIRELLSCVDKVSKKTSGEPYTVRMFTELQYESKFAEMKLNLERALEEARMAREKVEEDAKQREKLLEEKIDKLKQELEKAKQGEGSGCLIM